MMDELEEVVLDDWEDDAGRYVAEAANRAVERFNKNLNCVETACKNGDRALAGCVKYPGFRDRILNQRSRG